MTIKQQVTQLNEYTRCIDVFVPFAERESAIDTATSYYPLDYNASTGFYTRIDAVNALGSGFIVTMRQGYDY